MHIFIELICAVKFNNERVWFEKKKEDCLERKQNLKRSMTLRKGMGWEIKPKDMSG